MSFSFRRLSFLFLLSFLMVNIRIHTSLLVSRQFYKTLLSALFYHSTLLTLLAILYGYIRFYWLHHSHFPRTTDLKYLSLSISKYHEHVPCIDLVADLRRFFYVLRFFTSVSWYGFCPSFPWNTVFLIAPNPLPITAIRGNCSVQNEIKRRSPLAYAFYCIISVIFDCFLDGYFSWSVKGGFRLEWLIFRPN